MELLSSNQSLLFEVIEFHNSKVSLEEKIIAFNNDSKKKFHIKQEIRRQFYDIYLVNLEINSRFIIDASGDDFSFDGLYFIFKLGLEYGTSIQLRNNDKQTDLYKVDYVLSKYIHDQECFFWAMLYTEYCESTIKLYNSRFGTNFKLIMQDTFDGTEFSFISFKDLSFSEVFRLGQFFGFNIQFDANKEPFWVDFRSSMNFDKE